MHPNSLDSDSNKSTKSAVKNNGSDNCHDSENERNPSTPSKQNATNVKSIHSLVCTQAVALYVITLTVIIVTVNCHLSSFAGYWKRICLAEDCGAQWLILDIACSINDRFGWCIIPSISASIHTQHSLHCIFSSTFSPSSQFFYLDHFLSFFCTFSQKLITDDFTVQPVINPDAL